MNLISSPLIILITGFTERSACVMMDTANEKKKEGDTMSGQAYPIGSLKHEMEKIALLGFGGKKQPDEFDELINQRNAAVGELKANSQRLDSQISANESKIREAVANGRAEVDKVVPKTEGPKVAPVAPKPKTEGPKAAPAPTQKKPVMRDFGEHFQGAPAGTPKAPTATPAAAVGSRVQAKASAKPKLPGVKGKLGLLGGAAIAGGSLVGLNAMKTKNEQEKVAGMMTNRFLSKQADEEDPYESLAYLGGAVGGAGVLSGANAISDVRSAGGQAQKGIHPDVDAILARQAIKDRAKEILQSPHGYAGKTFMNKPLHMAGALLAGGSAATLAYQLHQANQEEQLASTNNRFLQ